MSKSTIGKGDDDNDDKLKDYSLQNTQNNSFSKASGSNEKQLNKTYTLIKNPSKKIKELSNSVKVKDKDKHKEANNKTLYHNDSFHNKTFTKENNNDKKRPTMSLKVCNSFIEGHIKTLNHTTKNNNHSSSNINISKAAKVRKMTPKEKLRKFSYDYNKENNPKTISSPTSNHLFHSNKASQTKIHTIHTDNCTRRKLNINDIYKYLAKNQVIKELDEPTNPKEEIECDTKSKLRNTTKGNFKNTKNNTTTMNTTTNTITGTSSGGNTNSGYTTPYKQFNTKTSLKCSYIEQTNPKEKQLTLTHYERKPLYYVKNCQIAKRSVTAGKSHKSEIITTKEMNNTFRPKNNNNANGIENQSFNKKFNIKMSHMIIKTDTDTNNDIAKNSNIFQGRIDDYIIGRELGKGAYAIVKYAMHKATNRKMAVKIYEKSALLDLQKKNTVKREINILKCLDHDNIVKLYEVIDGSNQLLTGESLLNFLKKKANRRIPEKECKVIFKQIVKAICYCHLKNICHRDIKLENIIVQEMNKVKVIDFGFGVMTTQKRMHNFFCGTPTYMAPEIVQKEDYVAQYADIWSLGILLFVMLCGSFPFKAANENELYGKIVKGVITFPEYLSDSVCALMKRILVISPIDRPSSEEILLDEWFDVEEFLVDEFSNLD